MARGAVSASRDNKLIYSRQFYVVIVILFIVLVFLLIHFVWDSPNLVFNQMLNNTLTTSSYTKTIDDYVSLQHSEQVITVETGAVNRAIETQTLSVPSYPKGSIKIVTVGTPTADYSKYTLINTNTKNAAGKTVNYKPALNIWGVSTTSSSLTEGQLFNSSVIDLVSMANLNPQARKILLSYMKTNKIYSFSGPVKSVSVNGRSELVYNVTVRLHYLQDYLNQFGGYIGLNQFNYKATNVSTLPTNYDQKVVFYIDTASRQLAEIKFPGSYKSYSYSSYGASPQINVPSKFVLLSTLETYIKSLSTK